MFCPNCGGKCEDDALFCETCGTSLAEAAKELAVQGQPEVMFNGQPQPCPIKKTNKKVSKILIAVIAGAAVVMAAAAVFIGIGFRASDYRKTAEKFLKAYVSGDYNQAYDYLNIPESEFLTPEAFKQVNSERVNAVISEIEVQDAYGSRESSLIKEVDIKYTLESGGSDWAYLNMERTDGKYLLFFKKYKVSASDTIAKEVLIKVPAGMTLSINGTAVSQQYIASDDKDKSKGYDYYQIPYLFQGENKLVISGERVEDYEQTFKVSYDEQSCYISNSNLNYKESVVNTLKEQAAKDLETLAAAGLANKDVSEISALAAPSFQSKVESSYASNVRTPLHSSSTEVSSLLVSNVNTSVNSLDYAVTSEGFEYIKVTLSYTLSGKYKYRFDTAERDGKSNTSTASITYAFEDGKWGIAMMSLNFYIH